MPGFEAPNDTVQTLEAFQHLIAHQDGRGADHRERLYEQLLAAIIVHRVADRPDRIEPRKTKRRPKRFERLMKPRHEAKRNLIKRLSDN